MNNTCDKQIRSRIYRIIKIGYVGDIPSRIFDAVIAVSILINLFIIFFETFDVSVKYVPVLDVLEAITVVIFTIEYLLRLLTADFAYSGKKTYLGAVIAFVFSLYGLIDLFSFLPYWLSFAFPLAAVPAGVVAFRMLRIVRILRLFRINRYYDAFNVISDVLKEKRNQIASAVFIILMLVLAASILMYNLEHDAQPDQFKNAFSGIWWAVSTLLTVGYGDIYPVTSAGRLVGIILAFLGVGIVAIPTGIISAGFVQQYTKIKDLAGTSEEYPLGFITIRIKHDHSWLGTRVDHIRVIDGTMLYCLVRNGETILPDDETVFLEGDVAILGSLTSGNEDSVLGEIMIRDHSEWEGARVGEIESAFKARAVLIKRDGGAIKPKPDERILTGDTLVVFGRNVGGKMI